MSVAEAVHLVQQSAEDLEAYYGNLAEVRSRLLGIKGALVQGMANVQDMLERIQAASSALGITQLGTLNLSLFEQLQADTEDYLGAMIACEEQDLQDMADVAHECGKQIHDVLSMIMSI